MGVGWLLNKESNVMQCNDNVIGLMKLSIKSHSPTNNIALLVMMLTVLKMLTRTRKRVIRRANRPRITLVMMKKKIIVIEIMKSPY